METATASRPDMFTALERSISATLEHSGETPEAQFDCLQFYVQLYQSCFDVAAETADGVIFQPLDDRCN